MKIFIDDVRECPNGWVLCTTAEQAINLLFTDGSSVTDISFDHDLGEGKTGYDVACFIEMQVFHGQLQQVPKWKVHSANQVGRRNIEQAMKRAERIQAI
jgi:hypothetical protein